MFLRAVNHGCYESANAGFCVLSLFYLSVIPQKVSLGIRFCSLKTTLLWASLHVFTLQEAYALVSKNLTTEYNIQIFVSFWNCFSVGVWVGVLFVFGNNLL